METIEVKGQIVVNREDGFKDNNEVVVSTNEENQSLSIKVKDQKPFQTEFFQCACYSLEHLFIMNYDPDYGDIWIDVHLNNYPWYKRIWIAIQYVFGFKSKYGCFSTWQMHDKDVERMQDFLKKKQAILKTMQDNGYTP